MIFNRWISRRWAIVWGSLLFCVLGGVEVRATPAPPATQPHPWQLFARGSADRLWYAVTTPPGGSGDAHTFIRTREPQKDWEDLADFPARLMAMSQANGRLIASLDGGEWKRIAPGQFVSGLPLPGGGDVLAIVEDDRGMWAVGIERVKAGPATASATQPAARVGARLFQLGSQGWKNLGPVPEPQTRDANLLSLLMIKGLPTLLYADAGGRIVESEWRDGPSPAWVEVASTPAPFPVRKLAAMELDGRMIAWAVGRDGPGALLLPDASGSWRVKPLAVDSSVAATDFALAAFHGELRLMAVTADEKFYEQRFNRLGEPTGSWQEMDQPTASDGTTLASTLEWAALAVLITVTLATANRGGVVQVAVVNKVRLAIAPLSLRLAAGLIDLWPSFIVLYLVIGRLRDGIRLSQLYTDTTAYWALGIAFAVYFLHTTIAEWIWGRSLGKMFVGLRVVALTGKRPSISSTLLRNLIRLLEVPATAPLVLVFLNPLRQRFGDFFAGTVVTMKLPREMQEKLD